MIGFVFCPTNSPPLESNTKKEDISSTREGVDRLCSAVHRGVSRDGRFIGGGARNQKPDDDTRSRDNDLDRFGPSDRRNTLRPVSLVYYIEYEMYVSCPLGDPCLSLYTLEG